jgi:transcriptional regulator with XRE-family HTH domain
MVDQTGPNVGQMIRRLRERRGLSLRALARQSGLSVNAISRIEHGENSPTVSSLHLLATALSVSITDFFEEQHRHATVLVKRDYRLVSRGEGILMESLGFGLRNQQLEPFLVTVEPQTGTLDEPITHPGQEFVFCLAGQIEFSVASQSYRLEPGDSLLFEASQAHCFFNAEANPATILLVFQAAEGSHLARRRHLETG